MAQTVWQAHSSASLPESLVSVHCPKQCATIDFMQRSGCTIGDSLSSQVSLPLLGVGGTVLSINGQQIDNSGAKHACIAALQFSTPQAQKIVNFNESTNQALNRQSFPESKISCASQCLDRIRAFQFMLPYIAKSLL